MTLTVNSPLGGLSTINLGTRNNIAAPYDLSLPPFIRNHYRVSDKKTVRFTFFVKEEVIPHFVLLKGLLEFHRGAHFSFKYNRESGSFDTQVHASKIDQLVEFFTLVNTLLERELAFKAALKKVIAFEREYRRQQAKAYAELMIG